MEFGSNRTASHVAQRDEPGAVVPVGNARGERRGGVFALKLAELPLPGQHPQRVAHFGAQAAREVSRARPCLEPVVGDDAREAEDVGVDEDRARRSWSGHG